MTSVPISPAHRWRLGSVRRALQAARTERSAYALFMLALIVSEVVS